MVIRLDLLLLGTDPPPLVVLSRIGDEWVVWHLLLQW